MSVLNAFDLVAWLADECRARNVTDASLIRSLMASASERVVVRFENAELVRREMAGALDAMGHVRPAPLDEDVPPPSEK